MQTKKSPTQGRASREIFSSNYTSIGFQSVRQIAAGQWGRIHAGLGIQLVTTSHHKHTACQGCGGSDRFRVCDDYELTGRWICGCGGDFQHGDGFALLGHVFGWSPAEQLAAVKRVLGIDDNRMSEQKRRELAQQAAAYQATMQARARAIDERRRLDEETKFWMLQLDDLIDYRRYCERAVRRALAPTDDEAGIAGQLVAHLNDAYGLGGAA